MSYNPHSFPKPKIKLSYKLAIEISSPDFPHYTSSHPPTYLPVVATNPFPQLVGVLILTAKSGRPDQYKRETLINKARNTPFSTGHGEQEVVILPDNSTFVCYAESNVIYRLPNFTEEQDFLPNTPDGKPRSGLRTLSFPIMSQFYTVHELKISNNLSQFKNFLADFTQATVDVK